MTTGACQLVLDSFACAVNASAEKHILLVLDNAASHTRSKLVSPQGIEAIFQPAYAPELQPAERLWQLSDELIANRAPKDLDDLEHRLSLQCERLMQDPERVKAHTLFHGWPRVY